MIKMLYYRSCHATYTYFFLWIDLQKQNGFLGASLAVTPDEEVYTCNPKRLTKVNPPTAKWWKNFMSNTGKTRNFISLYQYYLI